MASVDNNDPELRSSSVGRLGVACQAPPPCRRLPCSRMQSDLEPMLSAWQTQQAGPRGQLEETAAWAPGGCHRPSSREMARAWPERGSAGRDGSCAGAADWPCGHWRAGGCVESVRKKPGAVTRLNGAGGQEKGGRQTVGRLGRSSRGRISLDRCESQVPGGHLWRCLVGTGIRGSGWRCECGRRLTAGL